MKQQAKKTKAQPNRWVTEQWWRYLMPNDRRRANAVRRALRELGLYPRCDLAKNENLAVFEANCRAALPDMVAELDRTDVVALVTIARLLALVPREAGLLRGRGCPGE